MPRIRGHGLYTLQSLISNVSRPTGQLGHPDWWNHNSMNGRTACTKKPYDRGRETISFIECPAEKYTDVHRERARYNVAQESMQESMKLHENTN